MVYYFIRFTPSETLCFEFLADGYINVLPLESFTEDVLRGLSIIWDKPIQLSLIPQIQFILNLIKSETIYPALTLEINLENVKIENELDMEYLHRLSHWTRPMISRIPKIVFLDNLNINNISNIITYKWQECVDKLNRDAVHHKLEYPIKIDDCQSMTQLIDTMFYLLPSMNKGFHIVMDNSNNTELMFHIIYVPEGKTMQTTLYIHRTVLENIIDYILSILRDKKYTVSANVYQFKALFNENLQNFTKENIMRALETENKRVSIYLTD